MERTDASLSGCLSLTLWLPLSGCLSLSDSLSVDVVSVTPSLSLSLSLSLFSLSLLIVGSFTCSYFSHSSSWSFSPLSHTQWLSLTLLPLLIMCVLSHTCCISHTRCLPHTRCISDSLVVLSLFSSPVLSFFSLSRCLSHSLSRSFLLVLSLTMRLIIFSRSFLSFSPARNGCSLSRFLSLTHCLSLPYSYVIPFSLNHKPQPHMQPRG